MLRVSWCLVALSLTVLVNFVTSSAGECSGYRMVMTSWDVKPVDTVARLTRPIIRQLFSTLSRFLSQ